MNASSVRPHVLLHAGAPFPRHLPRAASPAPTLGLTTGMVVGPAAAVAHRIWCGRMGMRGIASCLRSRCANRSHTVGDAKLDVPPRVEGPCLNLRAAGGADLLAANLADEVGHKLGRNARQPVGSRRERGGGVIRYGRGARSLDFELRRRHSVWGMVGRG